MEKLMIYENLVQQNKAINDANDLCADVNKVLSKFKIDSGYSVTLEEVKKIMLGNGDVYYMLEKLNSFMDGQLDNNQIVGDLMRNNLKTGAKEIASGFVTQLKNFQNHHPGRDAIEHLSMEDGRLVLKDIQKEAIRESFRTYITNETALEFHVKHRAVTESLKDLSLFIKANTWINYLSIGQLAADLFTLQQDGDITPNPVDYDRSIKQTQRA